MEDAALPLPCSSMIYVALRTRLGLCSVEMHHIHLEVVMRECT